MSNFGKKENKPCLPDLDALFSLDGEENNRNSVVKLNINSLIAFRGHPFHLYEGERLEDMVASIKKNGVLIPVYVRKADNMYEILSGHNRTNAARLAGLSEIPALILEDITDEEAFVYVIETNLLQRSFTDMTHTEKAAVIALHHSKMFSQGKRTDILEKLRMLEETTDESEAEAPIQVAKKLTSIEKVGETYSLSKDTVARYLRINKLIPSLKERLDNSEFAFIPAVTLSFLKENEQELVDDCIERNALSVNIAKADLLRQYSDNNELNSESVYRILSGEALIKTSRVPSVKIDKTIYAKYFKPEQSAKEIQNITENALEMYFANM